MRALLIAMVFYLAACATPMPPSGGPADQTPPEIVETTPEQDAVNVSTDRITMTFSEHVDAGSFAGAFSITPVFDQPVDFNWRGRRVEIVFPEPLRENTTYLVTIDRAFRDARGVQLQSPITFAFSSGPTINRGTIAGTVLLPTNGAPASGVDVFAYARPDSSAPTDLPERPDYRTQTDDSGEFRFDYLNEQPYFVIAIRDDNRNFEADPAEAFAVPPRAVVDADTVRSREMPPWLLATLDTIPPEPLRVRPLTRGLHALRFSEPVRFEERNPDLWTLEDSLTGGAREIRDLFIPENEPTQVLILTEALDERTYIIVPAGVVDSTGNAGRSTPTAFVPSAQEDTLELRFAGFTPPEHQDGIRILPRGGLPGLRLSRPAPPEVFQEAVTVTDTIGTALPFVAVSRDGTLYEIRTDPPLERGRRIRVAVSGEQFAREDTIFTAEFERLAEEATGEIGGQVASDEAPVVVEVRPVDTEIDVPLISAVADETARFIIPGLPEGTYRVRAYADLNENQRWDGGTIIPFRPAEPVAWEEEPVRVRVRWETTLPDTLRIPTVE